MSSLDQINFGLYTPEKKTMFGWIIATTTSHHVNLDTMVPSFMEWNSLQHSQSLLDSSAPTEKNEAWLDRYRRIGATAIHGQAVQRELVAAKVHMDELVRRYWEVESCGEGVVTATKEELECEAQLKSNFCRLDYENKLERKPEVKVPYSAFIREYLDLNHMSVVPRDSLSLYKYFLPHHCAFKEHSTTTKLRVVLDGSAKTSSGHSLS
ncbi:uncharacterized protein LOC128263702 [Drosophila gunungcola]|uniref:uncharacterized protein LOC128263702 n=1 Tax=Drosophila gunungcola TaxID=103775 RepID=UPI0022E4FCF1|nr:uncharacterized protein LOC128263702 [Drosophila gunungcola]